MYVSCYIPLYLLYVSSQGDKAVQYLTFWTLWAVICPLSDEKYWIKAEMVAMLKHEWAQSQNEYFCFKIQCMIYLY